MAINININHCYDNFYIAYKNATPEDRMPTWVPVAKIFIERDDIKVVFGKNSRLSEEEQNYINERVSILKLKLNK